MRLLLFPGASTPGPAAILTFVLLTGFGFAACSGEDADDGGDDACTLLPCPCELPADCPTAGAQCLEGQCVDGAGDTGTNDVSNPEDAGDASSPDTSDVAETDTGDDTVTPPDTNEEDASDDADGSTSSDAADTSDAVAAVCGNGMLEDGESCDGELFDGQTCALEGFDDGDLACSESCAIDTSGCFNVECGDGTCNGDETFDVCRADCPPPEGLVVIDAGAFTAGSPEAENGRGGFEEQRQVTLTRDYLLQTNEVTQAEWTALSGGVNPSCFQSTTEITCSTANANPESPVETVDWYSAVAYVNALSARDGLTECYALVDCADPANGWQDGVHSGCTDATFAGLDCDGYRLPTDGEWEYAARAGTTTATPLGEIIGDFTDCTLAQPALDPIAWWCGNSPDRTQPVGTRAPNAWGLYDMHGNVGEWVNDRFDRSAVLTDETDPLGPSTGNLRTLRNSGYYDTTRFVRSGYRDGFLPTSRVEGIGFRIARTLR